MAEIIRKNKIVNILKIHLKFILIIYIIAIIGSIIFYFLSPKYYRATAEILKPSKTSKTNMSSEVILSLLNSNRMLDRIVKKFNLSQEYGTDNLDILRNNLKENTRISELGKKIIKIDVIDKNPETAAQIANFFCKNLNNLVYNLTAGPIIKEKKTIEENIMKANNQIKTLQNKMDKIEHKSKIIIVNNNNEGLNSLASYLMKKLIKEKLVFKTLEQTSPSNIKKIMTVKMKIAYIGKQIDKIIEYKKSLSNIQRDILTNESFLSLLNNQMEKAGISESNNIVPIHILDKAIAPTTVYKPNIKNIIIIISFIILGIGFVIIFFDALRFLGSL